MSKSPQRSFIPGDEWLYYKIYTGPKTADKILVNIIKPAVENLQKNGTINRWFFLRYADPKHHLRLRLHCPKTENIVAVLETLTITLSDLLSEDLIWKVQLDTYQREIERYGSNSITLAEEVFFQDSILVTNFLALANQYNSPNLRWLFSLRAIDSYLNDFGYSDERKRDLLEKMKVGFRSEFDNTRILGKQLDKKYRTNQKDISEIMEADSETAYNPLLALLAEKEANLKSTAQDILNLVANNQLQKNIDELLSSFIHMLMNRLFKSKNRMHEMVCYDFLYRYYKSMIARRKYMAKK